jgi:hypothetical protein
MDNQSRDTDDIGHPPHSKTTKTTHTTQTTVGAQCCLCRVCGFCFLTVWWVPNVVCVVCVVFVFLLRGGCPMLSVSCVWFLSSYCVVGAQCCLCRVCNSTHDTERRQKLHTRHRQHWAPTTQ